MKKIYKFITNIIAVLRNILLSPFIKKPKVLSCEDTLKYILENKVNIGRFGDGEIGIAQGKGISFQEKNERLTKKMNQVKNTKNFLVCIPNIFDKKYFNKKIITKSEHSFWSRYKLKNSYDIKKQFKNEDFLGDAFISRFYLRFKDKTPVGDYINKLKQLWNKKDVIIVEGYTSRVGCDNDILDNTNSIRRIVCPNQNAFTFYDDIINEVKKISNENTLVLLALGPTATVLSYELSLENIWALDLGHFDIEYEWFLAKTDKKIPVKNKHVNECDTLGIEIENEIYNSQIIKRIE